MFSSVGHWHRANGPVAVNRFEYSSHYPVAEPAEHWDKSKLLLERSSIELFDHLLRSHVLVTLGVRAPDARRSHPRPTITHVRGVCQSGCQHICAQVAVGEIRLGRRQARFCARRCGCRPAAVVRCSSTPRARVHDARRAWSEIGFIARVCVSLFIFWVLNNLKQIDFCFFVQKVN